MLTRWQRASDLERPTMSFREKLFIDKLFWQAKKTLYQVLTKRRQTFWGETPVVLRTRKYKYAGEVRSERTTVVKPQFHKVKLFSLIKQQMVEIETTPQMLRYIEACGGLDDYLLKTPDRKLNSDVASNLKQEIEHLYRLKALQDKAGTTLGTPPSDSLPSSPSAPAPLQGAVQGSGASMSETGSSDTSSTSQQGGSGVVSSSLRPAQGGSTGPAGTGPQTPAGSRAYSSSCLHERHPLSSSSSGSRSTKVYTSASAEQRGSTSRAQQMLMLRQQLQAQRTAQFVSLCAGAAGGPQQQRQLCHDSSCNAYR